MRVAIPEFDGRIVAVPFSFNEEVDDGDTLGAPVSAYRTVPDRVARVAGLAIRLARLRSHPAGRAAGGHRAVRLPDRAAAASATPSRSTPRPRSSPCCTPWPAPATGSTAFPTSGDALMAELIDAFTYERDTLTPAQLAPRPRAAARPALPGLVGPGGPVRPGRGARPSGATPPGRVYRRRGAATWSSPGSTWAGSSWPSSRPGASANGRSPSTTPRTCRRPTTTWGSTAGSTRCGAPTPSSTRASTGRSNGCPARASGCRPRCYPDVALGYVPLVYPFVVNDPGEGTQAKRRAHAVIVDHLLPPMTRADTYDDVARLEQLLDEHAQVAALDPVEAAGHPGKGMGSAGLRRAPPGPGGGGRPGGQRVRRADQPRRRVSLRAQGRPDPRRAARARRGPDRARPGSTCCWP